MIRVQAVDYASALYDATVELRREVLRRPLGLDFDPGQLAGEHADFHLGAFDGDVLVGCLVLTVQAPECVQMRQVAVLPSRQRSGIGRVMVDGSEDFARRKGYRRMILHARGEAVPFYEALGYHTEGDPFVEIGIPHRHMSKAL